MLASPRGFSQLATSFFAFSRQGIHTHALSSLTIKLTPFTESVFVVLSFFLPKRVLDAIASAPLPSPLTEKRQVNLLHPLICAFQWYARQIFNCQRSYITKRTESHLRTVRFIPQKLWGRLDARPWRPAHRNLKAYSSKSSGESRERYGMQRLVLTYRSLSVAAL